MVSDTRPPADWFAWTGADQYLYEAVLRTSDETVATIDAVHELAGFANLWTDEAESIWSVGYKQWRELPGELQRRTATAPAVAAAKLAVEPTAIATLPSPPASCETSRSGPRICSDSMAAVLAVNAAKQAAEPNQCESERCDSTTTHNLATVSRDLFFLGIAQTKNATM